METMIPKNKMESNTTVIRIIRLVANLHEQGTVNFGKLGMYHSCEATHQCIRHESSVCTQVCIWLSLLHDTLINILNKFHHLAPGGAGFHRALPSCRTQWWSRRGLKWECLVVVLLQPGRSFAEWYYWYGHGLVFHQGRRQVGCDGVSWPHQPKKNV